MTGTRQAPTRPVLDGSGRSVAALRGVLDVSRLSLRRPPMAEVLDVVARTVVEVADRLAALFGRYPSEIRPPRRGVAVPTPSAREAGSHVA